MTYLCYIQSKLALHVDSLWFVDTVIVRHTYLLTVYGLHDTHSPACRPHPSFVVLYTCRRRMVATYTRNTAGTGH